MIGLSASRRIQPNWEIMGRIYATSIKIGDVNGRARGYRAGTRYFITPNIGLGLAWSGNRYKFDIEESRWRGALHASDNGGELFVSLRF